MSQESTTLLVNVERTKLGNGKKEFRESIQRGGMIQQLHASLTFISTSREFLIPGCFLLQAFRK